MNEEESRVDLVPEDNVSNEDTDDKDISSEDAEESNAPVDDAEAQDAPADAGVKRKAPKKKKRRKLLLTLGIVLVVLVVALAGGYKWHEQPSFCNAICHQPMDEYNMTYNFASGAPAIDKWGNEVSDGASMLAVTHREAGVGCLDCHVASLSEQIQEGLSWLKNDFEYPLYERSLLQMTQARGIPKDEFCLNDSCHHVSSIDSSPIITRDDLWAATEHLVRNPHNPRHAARDCGECHNAHRASVNACSQSFCHGTYDIPAGWLTEPEERKLPRP